MWEKKKCKWFGKSFLSWYDRILLLNTCSVFCVTATTSLLLSMRVERIPFHHHHIHTVCLIYLHVIGLCASMCECVWVRLHNFNSTGTLPFCLRTNARLQITNYACHFSLSPVSPSLPVVTVVAFVFYSISVWKLHNLCTYSTHTYIVTQKTLISNDDCTVRRLYNCHKKRWFILSRLTCIRV